MGTTASQETSESGTPSEEGGARAAILGAARKVAERDGVIEMTLTAVANEARVAANDIYAFFTSKNDLLQAVVADDLAILAKTMRRSLEPQPDAADAGAAEKSPPEETQVLPMQAADTAHTEQQNGMEARTPAPEMPRRFPVVQARREPPRASAPEADAATTAAIAHLQEQVTKLESRPVDQWLERRLREFERSLVSLQQGRSERTGSNDSLELGLQELRDSIQALDRHHAVVADEAARASNERFDAVNRQLRETLSDLQADSVHLARRITALENLAFAARPDVMTATTPFEPLAEAAPPAALQDPQDQTAAADAAPHDSGGSGHAYLAAARRSAQAAAANANEDGREKTVARKPNRTLLYAACGSLAVFVVLLAAAGFVLRNASMNPAPAPAHASAQPAGVRAFSTAAAKPLPRLVEKAAPVLRKAPQPNLLTLAAAGDPSAELLVGLEYLDGKGLAKNETAAVDWLSRSAAKGQPVAQYDLGALYADGRGVQADAVQAFQWFGAAALRGNRRAMHFLAIAYAEGVGTAKNLPEAARWFERAAALGAVNSQFNLAVLYERGMGVTQSLPTAYKWYAIAAAQGDREAQARVAALAATLSPADLAGAKSAADAFKPEPLDAAANLPPRLPS
ncbi:MAG TPA: TetR family transcriptional regulator [Rhizomicrobium sp.]|jgi:TPR repeat protein/AcrR family transcriptional regulator|nr:TetR family transcriptional regulator [Rhizomicrobium sp.]